MAASLAAPDPDLTLSRHPARATARRLPPSIEYLVPPVAVDPISKAMACPLRSKGITPLQHHYGAVRLNSVTSSIEICRNPIIVIQCGLMATHGSFINRIGGREPVVISEVFCRFD